MTAANPYDLTAADIAYFDRGTQPMRRLDDGTLGDPLTLDELTEAMRIAGADDNETLLGSKLWAALDEVLSRRGVGSAA